MSSFWLKNHERDRRRNRRVDTFFFVIVFYGSFTCLFFDKTFPIELWLLRRRKMPAPHRVCVIRLFSLRWIFCSLVLLSILVHDVNHSQPERYVCVWVCTPISYWSLFLYIARARDAEMMMKGRRLMIYEHLLTAEGCGRAISLGASNFVRDNSDTTCRASTLQERERERVICAFCHHTFLRSIWPSRIVMTGHRVDEQKWFRLVYRTDDLLIFCKRVECLKF